MFLFAWMLKVILFLDECFKSNTFVPNMAAISSFLKKYTFQENGTSRPWNRPVSSRKTTLVCVDEVSNCMILKHHSDGRNHVSQHFCDYLVSQTRPRISETLKTCYWKPILIVQIFYLALYDNTITYRCRNLCFCCFVLYFQEIIQILILVNVWNQDKWIVFVICIYIYALYIYLNRSLGAYGGFQVLKLQPSFRHLDITILNAYYMILKPQIWRDFLFFMFAARASFWNKRVSNLTVNAVSALVVTKTG